MLLEMNGICKDYMQGKMPVHVLKDVSLQVAEGDYLAIMGPSGSGKTTLMNLIGCLDVPTSGTYLLNGEDMGKLKSDKLAQVRNEFIGFVFQSFYLLPKLTALDNVELPLLYAGVSKKERRARARAALQRMGLGDREKARPNQLSGGQCQRVAIARAIVTNPKLLLADEPTGALDSASGNQIMDIFDELNANGVTIIMITHEREVAARARRTCNIRDGVLSSGLPSYAAPSSESKASSQESNFDDIFASTPGGDVFSSGTDADTFSSGGGTFSPDGSGNVFSGDSDNSFSSGTGGDLFAGEAYSGSADVGTYSVPTRTDADSTPVAEDTPSEADDIFAAKEIAGVEAILDSDKPIEDALGLEGTLVDLFGDSGELTGHETDLTDSAQDVFATDNRDDIFSIPESEDVFGSSRRDDVFTFPQGDDLFADDKTDNTGDVFDFGALFSDNGEEDGNNV